MVGRTNSQNHWYAAGGSVPSSMSVAAPVNVIVSPKRKKVCGVSGGAVIATSGGFPTAIRIGFDVVRFSPSETSSTAEYTPLDAYTCVTFCPNASSPSPKIQRYVSGPSSSVAWPEKSTESGARPVVGVAVACVMTGVWLPTKAKRRRSPSPWLAALPAMVSQ